MKYIAIIIGLSFLAVIALGFIPMSHHMDASGTMNQACILAEIFNVACGSDALAMALMHVGSLQAFSNTPVSSIVFFAAVLVALGAAFISIRLLRQLQLKQLPIYFDAKTSQRISSQSIRKQTSWLSLFETSPNIQ